MAIEMAEKVVYVVADWRCLVSGRERRLSRILNNS
jgi:hypothetical protein